MSVSQSGRWILGGSAAVLVAALPLVLRAAPQSATPLAAPPPAAGQTFAALCKDSVVADVRPDPAWVLASYDGDNCRAPAMPLPPDGRRATREQITASMAAVTLYAARAQAFERCVSGAVAKVRPATPAGRSFLLVETHRILASEKNRKRAALQMAAAINAFNEYGSDCAEE